MIGLNNHWEDFWRAQVITTRSKGASQRTPTTTGTSTGLCLYHCIKGSCSIMAWVPSGARQLRFQVHRQAWRWLEADAKKHGKRATGLCLYHCIKGLCSIVAWVQSGSLQLRFQVHLQAW